MRDPAPEGRGGHSGRGKLSNRGSRTAVLPPERARFQGEMSDESEQFDSERLRKGLLELARLIRTLDQEGRLLDATPQLLKLLGDFRSQLFEYEVRSTRRLLPKQAPPPEVLEAERIVREAAKRLEEGEEGEEGQEGQEGESEEGEGEER